MAKKKAPKTWMLAPEKLPASPVPERLKAEMEAKADELVEKVLKPRYAKPPPKKPQFNYIIDIWTKWHGGYFYFGSTYACPGPNAISPSFESRFARLKHIGGGRFNLSYMRHNDKWWEVFGGLTVDECLELVQNDWHFALD